MFQIDVRATFRNDLPQKIIPSKNSVREQTSMSSVKHQPLRFDEQLGHQDLDHTALSIAELSLRLQLPRWGGKSALGLDGDGHDVEVPRGCLEGEDGGWLRLVCTFD